ncbi:MAG TPA: cysteine rich repeat-containing protein [Pseudomonadales bacterium]|nr:cysteine rich repeat-containing protein [Pseudomonadales bacterium]
MEKFMKNFRFTCVLIFMFVSHSVFAAAATGQNGACKADVEKYCAGVEKGGGRIKACLLEHRANLSVECKEKISKMAQKKRAKNPTGSAVQ